MMSREIFFYLLIISANFFNVVANDNYNPEKYDFQFKIYPDEKILIKDSIDILSVDLVPCGRIPLCYFNIIDSLFRNGLEILDGTKSTQDSLVKNIIATSEMIDHNIIYKRFDSEKRNRDLSIFWNRILSSKDKNPVLNNNSLFKKYRLFEYICSGKYKEPNLPVDKYAIFKEMCSTINIERSRFAVDLDILKPEKQYEIFSSDTTFSKKQKFILYVNSLCTNLEDHLYWGIYGRIANKLDTLWESEQFQPFINASEQSILLASAENSQEEPSTQQTIYFNHNLTSILRDAVFPEGLDFLEFFSLTESIFDKPVTTKDSIYIDKCIREFGEKNRNLAYKPDLKHKETFKDPRCKALDSLTKIETSKILAGLSSDLQMYLKTPEETNLRLNGKKFPDLFPVYKTGIAIKSWCTMMESNSIPFNMDWISTVLLTKNDIDCSTVKTWTKLGEVISNRITFLPESSLNILLMTFGEFLYYKKGIDSEKLISLLYHNGKLAEACLKKFSFSTY